MKITMDIDVTEAIAIIEAMKPIIQKHNFANSDISSDSRESDINKEPLKGSHPKSSEVMYGISEMVTGNHFGVGIVEKDLITNETHLIDFCTNLCIGKIAEFLRVGCMMQRERISYEIRSREDANRIVKDTLHNYFNAVDVIGCTSAFLTYEEAVASKNLHRIFASAYVEGMYEHSFYLLTDILDGYLENNHAKRALDIARIWDGKKVSAFLFYLTKVDREYVDIMEQMLHNELSFDTIDEIAESEKFQREVRCFDKMWDEMTH